jgi:hypothetical protein
MRFGIVKTHDLQPSSLKADLQMSSSAHTPQPVKSNHLQNWISGHLPKDIIEKAMVLIRNQTKFVLQLCAVLSQLNDHV